MNDTMWAAFEDELEKIASKTLVTNLLTGMSNKVLNGSIPRESLEGIRNRIAIAGSKLRTLPSAPPRIVARPTSVPGQQFQTNLRRWKDTLNAHESGLNELSSRVNTKIYET